MAQKPTLRMGKGHLGRRGSAKAFELRPLNSLRLSSPALVMGPDHVRRPQPMKIQKTMNNNNQIVVMQWTRQRSLLHDARFLEELPDLTHTKGHSFHKGEPRNWSLQGPFPMPRTSPQFTQNSDVSDLLLGIPWIWLAEFYINTFRVFACTQKLRTTIHACIGTCEKGRSLGVRIVNTSFT